MKIANRIGDDYSRACLQLGTGHILIHDRDIARGVESLRASLTSFSKMSAQRMVLEAIYGIGHCAVPLGRDREAVELISACLALNSKLPLSLLERRAPWIDVFHRKLRERLGEAEYSRAEKTGSRWTLEEATDAALAVLDGADDDLAQSTESPSRLDDESVPAELPQLTGRQLEVLRHLAQGRTDKEIAEALSISPRTAMTHVAHILTKLKVNRRSAASAVAIRAGLIPIPGADDDD